MRSARRWWLVFGLCAAVVAGALGWVSVVVLRLERLEAAVRSETGSREAARLALWRMDSWLASHLAREAARPVAAYQAFAAPRGAYTRSLDRIDPGDLLTPSPLLTFHSEFFPLHFQCDRDTGLTSPQVPTGPYRALVAENEEFTAGETTHRETLERLRPRLEPVRLGERLVEAEKRLSEDRAPADHGFRLPTLTGPRRQLEQVRKSRVEYEARVAACAPPPGAPENAPVVVGALVPLWLEPAGEGEDRMLVFARRVQRGGKEFFQGFLGDWDRLRVRLLAEARDLVPGATLAPTPGERPGPEPLGQRLVTVPALLVAGAPPPVPGAGLSSARITLGLTWLAAAAAAVAIGMTLRRSIALGERRHRFASAVTHELRTPLTTFRMYTEMLANGMVRDETQRRAYLDTLQEESERLSAMVENVLAYARLEEGRVPRRRERLTVGALLERVVPPLRRRAEEAGMTLALEAGTTDPVTLETDVEAVGQILFNLVDNAAKYGRDGAESTIRIQASAQDGTLRLRVQDHGPGISPDRAAAVFRPFDRAGRDPADPVPGVGLGLALARGLARDLGGDLTLEPSSGPGATLRLTLPIVPGP